jgi:spermidine synthase
VAEISSDQESPSLAGRVILLASVFAVAACGLVYELIAGAVSSYLLGDAVTQFSLVIGVFLSAMGLGSYLAKLVHRNLLRTFVEIEIWIGLIGGSSSILMFSINTFIEPLFTPLFYSLCAALGVMVGIEIPLLVRILRSGEGFVAALSNVLALDYIGALAGSILFPLLALPVLGLSRASVAFGLMNLAVAGAGISLIRGRKTWQVVRLGLAGLLLLVGFFTSSRLVGFLEDLLYQDSIVLVQDSRYQHIVITRWHDDIRLFLNGHLQLSSIDEARYHESLVLPAMAAAARPRNVLILGGGDGAATREILKFATVEAVTLVDIDPVMTELARTRPELVAINQGALESPLVTVVNQDAMSFLTADSKLYEVIIIDLPDPNTVSLARLYSRAFYALVARRLAAGGVMVTQATSPYFAPEAFWCIEQTIGEAVAHHQLDGLIPVPYHVHVPSFGEWGFIIAGKHRVDPAAIEVTVPTRFLTTEVMRAMFVFGRDMQAPEVIANELDDPVLYEYYKQGWRRFNE